MVGEGARLSVVVDRPWRAVALAEMIVEAGLEPEISRTDENTPLVRTSVDPRLLGIAAELDARGGQDGASALVARPARAAGLDAGGRYALRRTAICWVSTRTHRTPIPRLPRP